MPARRAKNETLREARAGAYRAVVRAAAERVFAESGFAGTRVEQIAKAAGVSVGTIYRAYPGKKREIYRDIHVHRGTEVLGRTQAAGVRAFQRGDVLDAMVEGIAAVVEYFVEHPDFLRIVLREEKAWAQGPSRQSAAQTVMWNEGLGGTEEGLRLAIASGLVIDESPALLARTMVALQHAHLGYWLESGAREPAATVAARLCRQVLLAFCRPELLPARLARLEKPPVRSRPEQRSEA
jgi:AcrR family transcriptional regulator